MTYIIFGIVDAVKGRERCGLHGFTVHDLGHTVGMRLREAGVPQSRRADMLWHSRARMTAHDSVAQVVEIREALDKITDEKHANNLSLASIIREAKVPTKVPTEAQRREAVLRFRPLMCSRNLAHPVGFEPTTPWFVVR
jgi:hypothetical protein